MKIPSRPEKANFWYGLSNEKQLIIIGVVVTFIYIAFSLILYAEPETKPNGVAPAVLQADDNDDKLLTANEHSKSKDSSTAQINRGPPLSQHPTHDLTICNFDTMDLNAYGGAFAASYQSGQSDDQEPKTPRIEAECSENILELKGNACLSNYEKLLQSLQLKLESPHGLVHKISVNWESNPNVLLNTPTAYFRLDLKQSKQAETPTPEDGRCNNLCERSNSNTPLEAGPFFWRGLENPDKDENGNCQVIIHKATISITTPERPQYMAYTLLDRLINLSIHGYGEDGSPDAQQQFKHNEYFHLRHDLVPIWIRSFELIGHAFFIAAIAGLIGIPIARFLARRKLPQCTKQLKEYELEIEPKNGNWKEIYRDLQRNNNNAIVSQLRRLKIEDRLDKNSEHYNCRERFREIAQQSDILGQIEEIYRDKHLRSNGNAEPDPIKLLNDSEDIRAIQRNVLFYAPLTSVIPAFLYAFVPFLFAMILSVIISWLILTNNVFSVTVARDLLLFFLGFGILLLSIPLVSLVVSLLNVFSGQVWRRKNTKYDELIYRVFGIFIYASLVLFIISVGANMLVEPNNVVESLLQNVTNQFDESNKAPHGSLVTVLDSFRHLLLPFGNSSLDSVFNLFEPGTLLIFRVILIASIAYIAINFVRFLIYQYNQRYFFSNSGAMALPPELVNLFGVFVVFIVSSFLTYLGILDYLYNFDDNPIAHGTTAWGANEPGHRIRLEDFIPYTIFVGLIAVGLSLSTRNLLENYFAGISLKVDSPFEEGDRIKLAGSNMLEAREIGIRSVELYDIRNNSLVSIPYNELARQTIHNFTEPDLWYRERLPFYINHSWLERCGTTMYEIEEIILGSAYMAYGIKTPNPENEEFFKQNFEDDSLRERKKLIKNEIIKKLNKVNEYPKNNNFHPYERLRGMLMFNNTENKVHEICEAAAKISYLYFQLSNELWDIRLKYKDNPSILRKIDRYSLDLLNAPRVETRQKITVEGDVYWEATLIICVGLSEQSDEVIHHLNLMVEEMMRVCSRAIEKHPEPEAPAIPGFEIRRW